MNEKQLKIFAGVFVFLLVVYFISKPRQSSVNLDDFVQNIVIGVGEDDVKSIEVYKETAAEEPARMAFVKAEDRWRIPTHYNAIVQKSKMDKLIRDLLEMTGNVRSSDPKHFDSYQISDIQGIHLLLKDEGGNTLANLIIGKRAEDYNAGFVRFADKEKVYSVDKNILSPLGVYGEVDTLTQFNVSFFIDLQAVNQDKEKLETIGLVANGKEIIIQKKDKEE